MRSVAKLVRSYLNHRLFLTGGMIFGIVLVIAALTPYLTAHDPIRQNIVDRLQSPNSDYLLGTDNLGRDLFSRVLWGARLSLMVGLSIVVISFIVGTFVGLLAGYFRTLDNVLMRLMDGLMAFPPILLAIALLAVTGPGISGILIALGIVYTPQCARIVRGQVLALREQEFIEAIRAQGASHTRIILRHILPNCIPPLVVNQSFVFAEAMIAEATLSFIGVGVPPPNPSWGNMLQEARPYMLNAPWMLAFPSLALVVAVVGINLVGDGLRDVLDPRNY